MRTNTAPAMMAVAASARIVGEVQSYFEPPQVANRTIAVVAIVSSAIPAVSIRALTCSRLGRCRKAAAAISASPPTGTLIQNTQRQPGPSVNQPPSSGPATEETAKTPPMMPMYLPRSRAGITSAMVACERIISPPPPMPWMTRAMISHVMSGASAPTTDPPTKMLMAMSSNDFRPKRSPSLP